MALSFTDLELGARFANVDARARREGHFVFDEGSDRHLFAPNGASASERSASVICSSDLSIPTASVGRLGCMMRMLVRAPHNQDRRNRVR
jgi:hypothetical protein